MTGFIVRKLDDRSLGDLLREKRLERSESLADVERDTQIARKYLEALEHDAFGRLPDQVYAKHFVRVLAGRYGMDGGAAIQRLVREMRAVSGSQANEAQPKKLFDRRSVTTPVLLKRSLLALAFTAAIIYFAFSVHLILKPPALIVDAPRDNQVLEARQTVLSGRTEPEAELTINQEQVLTETDGTFHETLTLPEGISILRIAAKKKHSKETEVYIKVIVEERVAME